MPEIFAQPLAPSCYRLFPDHGIAKFQWLGPDTFLPHARDTRTREPPHSEHVQLVCKDESRGQGACARQN
jgi:hypothetical protein